MWGLLPGSSFVTVRFALQEAYEAEWAFRNGLRYRGWWRADKMHGQGHATWEHEGWAGPIANGNAQRSAIAHIFASFWN